MKLSTRSRYATRALIEMARFFGKRPATRKELAQKETLSESYLENLLTTLKCRGLISTVRGAQGGYALSRPPETITVFDIVNAVEGNVFPVDCVAHQQECSKCDECVTREVWQELYEEIARVLHKYTLKDLLAKKNHKAGNLAPAA
ncbi:MAG: Rrf2 family transcriptional regulator [Chitinivibrionales bacterium]|nr:Rrf2 family transcriptional regulator [Chitinivibrionales bacterium]